MATDVLKMSLLDGFNNLLISCYHYISENNSLPTYQSQTEGSDTYTSSPRVTALTWLSPLQFTNELLIQLQVSLTCDQSLCVPVTAL
jgi:hypothetical protein